MLHRGDNWPHYEWQLKSDKWLLKWTPCWSATKGIVSSRVVFICTFHGIVCLRSLSESSLRSPNYLDQLKNCHAIAGNYIQTPKCETVRPMPYSNYECQSTYTAVETFRGQPGCCLREVFFLLLSQEKRASLHSPLCSFPQTAVSASRFSQLLYKKKHLSKPTLTSWVQCQLSEQNK